MDINTCFETTYESHALAYYSHLIPIIIGLLLSIFILFKTKFSKLAVSFFLFVLSFSLWLLGDLVTWVTPDYHQVYFWWSWLDYVNLIFLAFGVYFFGLMARNKISLLEKIATITIPIPLFILAMYAQTVVAFNQPWCEAINHWFDVDYKLFGVFAYSILLLISIIISFRQSNLDISRKIRILVVGASMLLFFLVFGIGEYISSITANYELMLYALFSLPIFLIVMAYTISNLGLFRIAFLGTQLLVYVLIIIVSAQFMFVESSTDYLMTIFTFISVLIISYLLINNTRREIKARERIEQLVGELATTNKKLRELDKQKTEFISFATHQLRSPLTSIYGNTSMITEGDFGKLSPALEKVINTIYVSVKTMISVVEGYLNVSRIELGTMEYNFEEFDLKDLIHEVANEQKISIETKGLQSHVQIDDQQTYQVNADRYKLKQVLMNIVDNSIKYTPQGKIEILINKTKSDDNRNLVQFKISDTGVGIAPDVMPKLFSKFTRADKANETNIYGTGLGLFIAKEIIKAHNGRIWAESEGDGKGSQLYVELPLM